MSDAADDIFDAGQLKMMMEPTAQITKSDDLAKNYNRIWLQPQCCVDERSWCADDPGPCEECGLPSIEYIRADLR